MYELLGIGIKSLDNGGFKFYEIELIHKVLEDKETDNCNYFTTPIRVNEPLGKYENGLYANIYWTNSYVYITGMMLYLE